MASLKQLFFKPIASPSVMFSLSSVAAIMTVASPCSAAVINVPANGSIQAAIQAARNGDTITVAGGTYQGPIVVTKKVELAGSTDPANPSVVVNNGTSGFDVIANGVNIHNFTIQGTTSSLAYPNAGINLRPGNARILTGNTLTGNGLGVYVEGAESKLTVSGNTFTGNYRSANLGDPNNEFYPSGGLFAPAGALDSTGISTNSFSGNGSFSINIGGGSALGLVIDHNTATNEGTFLVIGGTTGAQVTFNTVTDIYSSGIYSFGQNSGMTITDNTLACPNVQNVNGSGIILTVAYGATTGDINANVRRNDVSKFFYDGISLRGVTNSTFRNNRLLDNRDGIRLQNSQSNTIQSNTALRNYRHGIGAEVTPGPTSAGGSTGNTISVNTLNNNGVDAYEDSNPLSAPVNTWSGNTSTTMTANRPGLF